MANTLLPTKTYTTLQSNITSYDVLLRKHKDNHIEIVSFADFVGNRRFQITLEINRSSYNQAISQNNSEQCEQILNNIAHTICHECVPKGRFLEQVLRSTDNGIQAQWYDLGDGPLARERIRRGFLGLLFFIPIKEIKSPGQILAVNERRVVNVNLADKRFKIKCTSSDKSISSIYSSQSSDSESDYGMNITSRQKMRSISKLSTPTIIPAVNIRSDDVLFYEQNSGEIFDSNHTGNKRLLHIMRMKCSDNHYEFSKDEDYSQCAGEVIQGLIGAYPKARFLHQHRYNSNSVWCRMDIHLAQTVIKSLMLSALSSSSHNNWSCKPQIKTTIISGTKNSNFEPRCGWASPMNSVGSPSKHRMEISRAA